MTAPCLPVDVPDVRNLFLERWRTSVGWRIVESQPHPIYGPPPDAILATSINAHIVALDAAALFWVSEEMCDLLYATYPSVPGGVEPQHVHLPSQTGLVVLAKPWHGIDARRDSQVITDAVEWSILPERHRDAVEWALHVTSYRFLRWEAMEPVTDLQIAAAISEATDMQGAGRFVVKQDDSTFMLRESGTAWIPLGRSSWERGVPIDQPSWDEPADGSPYYLSTIEDRRFIAALASLLDTAALVETREIPMPRHVARREQREGREPSRVKIVLLRRPAESHAGNGQENRRDWSHRWIVSAHWRNQACGPGRRSRRLTLIGPYVKGPEDKPVVVKETVRTWVR